jgi:miniconductance mechanosensitive channel
MTDYLNEIHPLLPPVAGVLVLLLAALIADVVVKRIVLRVVHTVAKRSSVTWDDALVEHNVVGRLVQVVPALIVYLGVTFVPGLPDALVQLTRNVATGYMVLVSTMALTALLGAANTIYSGLPVAKTRPLKGFVQLLQIMVWVFGAVLIVAAILDRSPLLLLSGFGAMTAILLLVFKDTILSLVASVQLTAQDMVRVGDWIEMPQFGADGDVIDIQLHTVTVQNWDKTITTIPTHRLISDSFKNWRGMSQSGGRRIKRAIYLDVNSIRFQTAEEVEHFKRFALLKDYISRKEKELAEFNASLEHEVDDAVNKRRLTNIGSFRAYAVNYLKYRSDLHKGMTLMVRQLASGPEGLPLEIYCFTNTTAWVQYEGIQADIFDHLLAIVPEFGLRLYQKPAGSDLARLTVSYDNAAGAGEGER